MWAIENATDFAADGVGVTDVDGRNSWVVVVKATFEIAANGTLEPAPADAQEPFHHLPVYSGEDGASSLLYEADATPKKPGVDVLLNGDAWAPGERPASRVEVGMRVADRLKTLVVHGPRTYERQLSGLIEPSASLPFVHTPITYEGAFGGQDLRPPDPAKQKYHAPNPVGAGLVRDVGERAPNIEYAGSSTSKSSAGFGAIASFWEPRASLAGTYDAQWVRARKPLLPKDFDPRYFMCAPTDQQFPPLRGGEVIELRNLTPSGHCVLQLPKRYFGFTTICRGRAVEHRAQLDTVVIEPTASRLIMSWKSQLDCHKDFDYIDFTRIVEKDYVELAP